MKVDPWMWCTSYIKNATREAIGVVAVQDKTVWDSYISGTISDDQLPKDVVDPLSTSQAPSSMEVDNVGEPSDFMDLDAPSVTQPNLSESELLDTVINRERSVHNSKSILVAPFKDFKTLLLSQIETTRPNAPAAAARPSHDRYQARPDQEFYRDIGLGTEGIDTRGSMFLGAASSAPASSSAASRSQPEPSSSSNRDKRPRSEPETQGESKRSKTGLVPIIVVPGVASSPVNRFNMKKFFEEGVFEAIDPNDPNLDDNMPHKITFMRKKENGEEIPYEVVDNTSKFTPADWERVVSIFTIGKLWQFKAYPYKEDRIADMFQKHCGVYLRLGSEKIPQDTIAKWKVKIINVSKSHRHSDAATLREFWDAIDHFVKTNKINHLRY
jgi:hypothetical protein